MKKMIMMCMLAVIAALTMNASGIQGSSQGNSDSGDIHSRVDVVKAKTTDVYKVYFSSRLVSQHIMSCHHNIMCVEDRSMKIRYILIR